jgi:hypothetical protein
VAVSPLPPERVSDALLARGMVLAPAGAVPDAAESSGLPAIDHAAVAPTWFVSHRPVGEPLPDVATIGAGLGPQQHTALAAALTRPAPARGRRPEDRR